MAQAALLLLFAAGSLTLPPALDELAAARADGDRVRARLRIAVPVSAPLLPAATLFKATDRSRAEAVFVGVLRDAALRDGVLIEQADTAPYMPQPAVGIRLVLSGDASHVLRFVETIENRSPLVRFARWRLEPATAAGSALRLDALAVAVQTDE